MEIIAQKSHWLEMLSQFCLQALDISGKSKQVLIDELSEMVTLILVLIHDDAYFLTCETKTHQ